MSKVKGFYHQKFWPKVVSECQDGNYCKLLESRNLIDGWDTHVRQKSSHFQRFGLKIFIITAKVAKVQKLGVRDGLLGVVRVGGGKQKITV